ncbi:hypothetical protein J2S77_001748 [Alkalibacillus salilacus]|uniref:Uncharacterized protein n=1 Tax=Alkalibacillus salilacus TaxID=284582 RepID=A0ABT9VFL4_9BACI|nr:hypothetical protein [Alkalibacillus salilacus]
MTTLERKAIQMKRPFEVTKCKVILMKILLSSLSDPISK